MRAVDSDVLIDILNGQIDALAWLATLLEVPFVPSVVKLEVIAGCRNAREQRVAEALLRKFPTLYTSPADQERALLQFQDLHLRNAIGLADILIAETAKGASATLCTLNEKHMRIVPDLMLEVPYRKGK